MPTWPSNRQLDATIAPWPRTKEATEVDRKLLGNLKPRHTLRRQVDLSDAANFRFVRFFVTVDPASRDVIHQGTYLPASSTVSDFRIPLATYVRVVRHALAHADQGHLRFELRQGKIRLLGEDDPILLGPLPPRQGYYREPRKRLELDQIAEIYRANPRAPMKAVQRELNVSYRTAARRVAEARAADLLPRRGESTIRT